MWVRLRPRAPLFPIEKPYFRCPYYEVAHAFLSFSSLPILLDPSRYARDAKARTGLVSKRMPKEDAIRSMTIPVYPFALCNRVAFAYAKVLVPSAQEFEANVCGIQILNSLSQVSFF